MAENGEESAHPETRDLSAEESEAVVQPDGQATAAAQPETDADDTKVWQSPKAMLGLYGVLVAVGVFLRFAFMYGRRPVGGESLWSSITLGDQLLFHLLTFPLAIISSIIFCGSLKKHGCLTLFGCWTFFSFSVFFVPLYIEFPEQFKLTIPSGIAAGVLLLAAVIAGKARAGDEGPD